MDKVRKAGEVVEIVEIVVYRYTMDVSDYLDESEQRHNPTIADEMLKMRITEARYNEDRGCICDDCDETYETDIAEITVHIHDK